MKKSYVSQWEQQLQIDRVTEYYKLEALFSYLMQLVKTKQTYKPYTLVRPSVTRPVQDPLAVLRLEN